jgi:hypothetical protein
MRWPPLPPFQSACDSSPQPGGPPRPGPVRVRARTSSDARLRRLTYGGKRLGKEPHRNLSASFRRQLAKGDVHSRAPAARASKCGAEPNGVALSSAPAAQPHHSACECRQNHSRRTHAPGINPRVLLLSGASWATCTQRRSHRRHFSAATAPRPHPTTRHFMSLA